MAPGAAEAAGAAFALFKSFYDIEFGVDHRDDDHLRDALHRVEDEGRLAAVPAGNEELSLVVRVDQADQVAEHDTVFVAQAGARQDHRRHAGVAEVDGDAGGDQVGLPRMDGHDVLDAGAQVEPGLSRRGIAGRMLPEALVENFDVDFLQILFHL